MEKAKLKPCPFCGGEAWERIENNQVVEACFGCAASIRRNLVPPAEWWVAVHNAREAWNKRMEQEDA